MPSKPKRPCSFPGCPKLTHGRFCEEHAKLEARRYEKYDRDPAVRRRYGRAWKRIRDRYIAAHPLCEECKKQGKLTPAEEVHHVIPLSRGGTHAESNLMALCKPCHSAITARDGDRWRKNKAVGNHPQLCCLLKGPVVQQRLDSSLVARKMIKDMTVK